MPARVNDVNIPPKIYREKNARVEYLSNSFSI